MIGILLLSHGLLGLTIEGEHLLGIFNVDFLADLLYLACAAALLFVGSTQSSAFALRAVLGGVALLMLLIGLLGLADHKLGGLLPTGLGLMDFLVFFGIAGACALAAVLPRIDEPLFDDSATRA